MLAFTAETLQAKIRRNRALHLELVEKRVVDFLFANWTVLNRSYGWYVNLIANARWKRTSLTNLCWCQKTTVITLSCGVNILAVCSFIFVTKRVWRSDGQTDRITITNTALAQLRRAVKIVLLQKLFVLIFVISMWNVTLTCNFNCWWETAYCCLWV